MEEESPYLAIKYKLVENEEEANEILTKILSDKDCVIGVDVEAAVEMSRFGILCLLQVFENSSILKIFHDCSEDSSILCNLYKFSMNNIFDSQIAHRMCYEDIVGSSLNTKHSSISLNNLLKEYLNIDHKIKNEMHSNMTCDPYFWKKV